MNIPSKSSCWYPSIPSRASSLSSTVSARIIFLKFFILSVSKNMCSVLQRPMPSAPNLTAVAASAGVSAFVLTLRVLTSSAQLMNFAKFPETSGSWVGSLLPYTFPVDPSREIQSPSLNLCCPIVKNFASSFILISPHPDTQHVPIPLATTAAWLVIPPLAVRIPCDTCIPSMSSGDVSSLTRITCFSPFANASAAASAVK